MYTVTKIITFDAAHKLRCYNGACANLHGHTYKLKVTLSSDKLNEQGMVMDFKDLKAILKEVIMNRYDHAFLNDIEPFDKINPTAENMTKVFYDDIKTKLNELGLEHIKVNKITLFETKDSYATYEE